MIEQPTQEQIKVEAIRTRFRYYRKLIEGLEKEIKAWQDSEKFTAREWAEEARMYRDIEEENRCLRYDYEQETGRRWR